MSRKTFRELQKLVYFKKCGWKNLEKNENAVSASQTRRKTRKEKMVENTVKNRGND